MTEMTPNNTTKRSVIGNSWVLTGIAMYISFRDEEEP